MKKLRHCHPMYTLIRAKFRLISAGSVYSVARCWRINPIFADFWTSAFSVDANWQQSEKVEHGCTTTNLLLSKTVCFCTPTPTWRNRAQSL